MKTSVDYAFQTSSDGKRKRTPFCFPDLGTAVVRHLAEKLYNYSQDQFVELIRVRFYGAEDGGFMAITAITSIRLFDFQADSRREVEWKYGVDPRNMGDDFAREVADDLYMKIDKAINEILSLCKRKKIRFVSGHKVVEFLE